MVVITIQKKKYKLLIINIHGGLSWHTLFGVRLRPVFPLVSVLLLSLIFCPFSFFPFSLSHRSQQLMSTRHPSCAVVRRSDCQSTTRDRWLITSSLQRRREVSGAIGSPWEPGETLGHWFPNNRRYRFLNKSMRFTSLDTVPYTIYKLIVETRKGVIRLKVLVGVWMNKRIYLISK